MKVNKAPEKIYLEVIYPDNGVLPNGLNYTPSPTDIEYTRTDVFINNALKWYCLDCECNDNCKDTKCFFYREFERYLEGGTNALPPKFSNRILTEDGSTSNDWRYRHFTSKMQDAFIEKACDAYCKVCGHFAHSVPTHICRNDCRYFSDFKNYMKGE